MSKLRVESFTISLDGFGAGPDQVGPQACQFVRAFQFHFVSAFARVSTSPDTLAGVMLPW